MPTSLFLLLFGFSLLTFHIVLVIKRVDCHPEASNIDVTKDELLISIHLHLLRIPPYAEPGSLPQCLSGARKIQHQMSFLSFLVASQTGLPRESTLPAWSWQTSKLSTILTQRISPFSVNTGSHRICRWVWVRTACQTCFANFLHN